MNGLLRELCLINGVSGDETDVREFIIDKIKDKCEYRTDNLGNLICFKKGRKTPKNKLMICAHMDEVGFIVTAVRSDGTLAFETVGGIDASVVIGRQVTVKNYRTGKVYNGVVGSTAVHNLSKEQREKAPKSADYTLISVLKTKKMLKNTLTLVTALILFRIMKATAETISSQRHLMTEQAVQ